jgi:hypothetical protein
MNLHYCVRESEAMEADDNANLSSIGNVPTAVPNIRHSMSAYPPTGRAAWQRMSNETT